MALTLRLTLAMAETIHGNGFSVSHLDDMGDGYGFRKVRRELGVTAFGINALVIPPGYEAGMHFHEEQEETYLVHRGEVEIRFGDGSKHVLHAGGMARVDAHTHRGLRNIGQDDAIVVVAGGKDGYVGRDGQAVDANAHGGPPGAGSSA
jgi:mannose-6-phosphate isomerase-like protein (cupin superfamily)